MSLNVDLILKAEMLRCAFAFEFSMTDLTKLSFFSSDIEPSMLGALNELSASEIKNQFRRTSDHICLPQTFTSPIFESDVEHAIRLPANCQSLHFYAKVFYLEALSFLVYRLGLTVAFPLLREPRAYPSTLGRLDLPSF